jgi:hypothetical protein
MCRHSRTWAAEALREWQGTGYGIKRKSAGAQGVCLLVATQPLVVPAESQADRLVRMAFRCRGRNGEQMIGVLDGTRDPPGACAWRLMSSSSGLLVRRQP